MAAEQGERRAVRRRADDFVGGGELSTWEKGKDAMLIGFMGLMAFAMIAMMRGMSELNAKLGVAITASEGHAALERSHYEEFLRTKAEMEEHYREDRETFKKLSGRGR